MPIGVMSDEPPAILRAISAAAFAGALCVAFLAASPAAAFPGLREGLFGGHPADGRQFSAPPVARYVSEDGDVFVLDRSQAKPLLKFENSVEVWALQPQPAPRGDTIYKNDLGEPVLRATRLGGVTVFTGHRPEGEAAALAGAGPPRRLLVLGPQALLEKLAQASLHASHALHHGVLFDAEATPASSALIADAALITSLAVARSADKPEAQGFLSKLRRVFLIEGRKPAAQFAQGTLKITVAPDQGIAGRPSSDRIMQIAETFR